MGMTFSEYLIYQRIMKTYTKMEGSMNTRTLKVLLSGTAAFLAVTLFVSGCTNACKNCFQPETWDFQYGQPFTEETEEMQTDELPSSEE